MIHALAGTAGRAPRWWMLLAALAVLCAAIVVLTPSPAHAQESPDADALTRGESEPPSAWERDGRIAPARYQLSMPIGFDPAHGAVTQDSSWERLKRIPDSAMYIVAAMFHDFGKLLNGLSVRLLDLAFSFTVIDSIDEAVRDLSNRMRATFVLGIGLDSFAVFLAVFYCGIQLLRRRTAHSLGELTASMLIAVIGTMLVGNPDDLLNATAATVQNTSLAIMDLATDAGHPTPGDTESPQTRAEYQRAVPKGMSDRLYDSMIVESYDMANWGELLTGRCAAARDRGLRGEIEPVDDEDPDDALVRAMWSAGDECHDAAIYNTSMSPSRVGLAVITFLVSLVLFVFNGAVSGSVIGAQFVLGQVVVLSSLFVVAGTVPGTGRQIMLKGINAMGQAGAAVILGGFLLLMLVTFQTTLLMLPGKSPLTRYTLVLVMVFMLWRHRGPLRDMINEIILHFTQRLKTHSPGNVAPNLLGDRELWENSMKKRLKENVVDSSYRRATGTLGKGARLLRRKRSASTAGSDPASPSTGPGAPTAPTARRRPWTGRRTPKQYVHDVKEGWKRGGRTTMKLMKAAGRGTKATGRGLRKGVVRAGGVAGILTKGGFYKETGKDLGMTVGDVSRAGARATERGIRATAHAVARTPAVTARLTRAAKRAGKNLGHDMAESFHVEREYPRSVLPGAHKRVMRRHHAGPKRKGKTP